MYEENESLLVTQAHNGVPILVPWGHQALIPGTGFKSENIMSHPWMDQSAFTPFDSQTPYIQYESQGDRRAYFRSAESNSHGVSTQHYSGSLGATVDLSFAKVNVTGSYDKDIKENKDSTKVSRNAFYRAGMLHFAQEPELNAIAYNILSKADGEKQFRAIYGDYFIAGFILGADSGAFMSVDDATKQVRDTVALRTTVKVCFFKAKTWATSSTTTHVDHSLVVNFAGYDTMNDIKMSNPKISLADAQRRILDIMELADTLETRVAIKLKDLGIEPGRKFTLSESAHLCASGVVVQVLLLPFHTLRGYQYGLSLSAKNRLTLQMGM